MVSVQPTFNGNGMVSPLSLANQGYYTSFGKKQIKEVSFGRKSKSKPKKNTKEKPKKKPKLHKMVKNDLLIRNELTNVLKIQKIHNFTKFFYVFENSYELVSNNLKTINNLLLKYDNCELTYLKIYFSTGIRNILILRNFY